MDILYVTTEVAPFSSSGSLGELAGNLPRALRETGVNVTVLTPHYSDISAERYGLARRIRTIDLLLGGEKVELGLFDGKFINSDVPVIFLDHPESFHREGYYGDSGGPYPDNHKRFHIFCQGALNLIASLGLKFDLIHVNDWQTGLLPLLLRRGGAPALEGTRVLFTLHDLSFLGLFGPEILDELAIGSDLFHPEGIEFHGQVSLLKAGLLFADQITTLSPSYSREIQTEEHGGGLHGLLASMSDKLHGIVPGIDPSAWDPAQDHRLEAPYTSEEIDGKAACKRALQAELGLQIRPELPLVLMVGPFSSRHGVELVLKTLPRLSPHLLQLAFLGGDPGEHDGELRSLCEQSPGAVAFKPELDLDGIHRVLSGADVLLLPARYEPGGQTTHLKALRYGTIPVVRAVGGLRDTVVDYDEKSGTGTGICFSEFSEESLLSAIYRILALYRDQSTWQKLLGNAMRQTHDLKASARQYVELYSSMLS
jgi:starch synthase